MQMRKVAFLCESSSPQFIVFASIYDCQPMYEYGMGFTFLESKIIEGLKEAIISMNEH